MATAVTRGAASLRIGLAVILISSFTHLLYAAAPYSAPAPFPQTISDATPEQREAYALSFVNDKLQVWQKRLNLPDWTIKVKLVRKSTLDPKTLGGIRWDRGTMTATMNVLSTYDYHMTVPEMLDDMEFTIVHELVHLHLSPLPRSEASRTTEEHVVNEIAATLIKLTKR
jgi:hypothetical protein